MYRMQPNTNSNKISNLIRNIVKKMPQGKVFTVEELLQIRSIKSLTKSENVLLRAIRARVIRSLSCLHEGGKLRQIQNQT